MGRVRGEDHIGEYNLAIERTSNMTYSVTAAAFAKRKQPWDPSLISAQILALQAANYVTLGFILFMLDSVSGHPLTLQQVFSPNALRVHSVFGGLTMMAHLMNSVVGSVLLVFIVERAKQCLDFTVTAYTLNLVNCCLYEGFPVNWEWWFTSVVGATLMAVLGECLCMKYEIRDIPLRLNQ